MIRRYWTSVQAVLLDVHYQRSPITTTEGVYLDSSCLIAALTREHGGWEQACLRTSDERRRVQCLVPARGARRGKALDEGSAAIPRDAVARNAGAQPRLEAGATQERRL